MSGSVPPPLPDAPAPKGVSLSVSNLCWGPKAGLRLVDDMSFSLAAGERLAIIGPNGAGKSSLLRCLYRGVRPTGGLVALDGVDLWSLAPREVVRRVAVVLQDMPADFPFSVRDVVLMGRIPRRRGVAGWSDHDRQVTAQALEQLDLKHLAARQFSTLSGGEKQRVLVARALAQQPELIILDEPTNHLDIRHQLEILDLLRGFGLTIVVTLHDINLAAGFATRIAVIDRGRLAEFGPPEAVLRPEILSAAFGVALTAHRGPPPHAAHFTFSLRHPQGARPL